MKFEFLTPRRPPSGIDFEFGFDDHTYPNRAGSLLVGCDSAECPMYGLSLFVASTSESVLVSPA
jgi:hypothetical protein